MNENNYKKAGTFYFVGNVFNKGIDGSGFYTNLIDI